MSITQLMTLSGVLAGGAVPLETLSLAAFVSNNGGTGGNDLQPIPSSVQAGDIIVCHHYPEATGGGTTLPSGYTNIASNSAGGYVSKAFFKISDGTEGGTSPIGLTGAALSISRRPTWILRANRPIETATVAQYGNGYGGNSLNTSNPGNITLLKSNFTYPTIVLGWETSAENPNSLPGDGFDVGNGVITQAWNTASAGKFNGTGTYGPSVASGGGLITSDPGSNVVVDGVTGSYAAVYGVALNVT
jgi:hypothetical protein